MSVNACLIVVIVAVMPCLSVPINCNKSFLGVRQR
jgi:hypothetical protein